MLKLEASIQMRQTQLQELLQSSERLPTEREMDTGRRLAVLKEEKQICEEILNLAD